MNCKQGELAIIVKSLMGHEGKIVKCLKRYDGPWDNMEPANGWVMDISLLNRYGYLQNKIVDSNLRPIRSEDGKDETLSWKDVPSKETV